MTEINIFDNEDGQFCLTLMDADDATYALFDERELQGGGYTWQGIVQALLEMRMPEALPRLSVFDAEADNMYLYSEDKTLLESIAALIREAVADRSLLLAAMDHAGDDLE